MTTEAVGDAAEPSPIQNAPSLGFGMTTIVWPWLLTDQPGFAPGAEATRLALSISSILSSACHCFSSHRDGAVNSGIGVVPVRLQQPWQKILSLRLR